MTLKYFAALINSNISIDKLVLKSIVSSQHMITLAGSFIFKNIFKCGSISTRPHYVAATLLVGQISTAISYKITCSI
jgi:hypothetical protein